MVQEITEAEIAARIAACHPDVRTLYEYWRVKAGPRAMPRRADIEPADIKRHLSSLILVDVVPDERRLVYRLVGTREVAERGYDPTGKPVGETFYGGSAQEAMDCYGFVIERRAPFCYRDPFPGPDGRIETSDILYLPLSEDGATVNMIMVYSYNHAYQPRSDAASLLGAGR